MSWSFAAHFAALGTDTAVSSSAEDVRADLGRALKSELRRRGLWGAPPAYVGVLGWAHWDREALEELTAECYLYQLARLRSLRAQARAGADIDRFVLLNVRHFLFERQRANDPLGYRVFQLVVEGVERAAATDRLWVLGPGGEKVHNDSVLALVREYRGPAVSPEALAPIARRWNDDLLPALVTARGRPQREALVERLAGHLAALPAAAVRAVRLGDLVAPLKADARRRWAALAAAETETAAELAGDETGTTVVRMVGPDTSCEERERFEKLVACAAGRIARLPAGRGAGDLLSLLTVLVRHARDPDSVESPSQRLLARQAAVPRHRLQDHLATLGEILAACGRAIDRLPDVREGRWRSGPGGDG